MEIEQILRKIPLFVSLSGKEIADIGKKVFLTRKSPEEIIFCENSEGDELYIIVRGKVLIYRTTEEGKIKTLAILEKGDFFGEMALLSPAPRSANAKALSKTDMLGLRARDFHQIMNRNTRVCLKIIDTLCQRLRNANEQIQTLSYQSVPERIRLTLLELARRQCKKNGISLDVTQQDIAEMAATAREGVNRTLRILKKNDLVFLKKKQVEIPDLKRLRNFRLT